MGEKDSKKYDHWEDDGFIEELQKRETTCLNGTAKTYSLDEAIENAKQFIKKKREEK